MGEKIVANDLYEYLEYIRKMPGVLLGGRSISVLYNFIEGYQTACWLKDMKETLEPDLANFHDFVNDYYLHGPSTAGWKNVILAQHYGDEKAAFDDFFRLLDLFKEGYPIVSSRKVILQLIEKMINDPKCLSTIDDDIVVSYFKKLPSKLEEGQSLFDYYMIMCDIKEMSSDNEMLSKLICDITGSDLWLEAE